MSTVQREAQPLPPGVLSDHSTNRKPCALTVSELVAHGVSISPVSLPPTVQKLNQRLLGNFRNQWRAFRLSVKSHCLSDGIDEGVFVVFVVLLFIILSPSADVRRDKQEDALVDVFSWDCFGSLRKTERSLTSHSNIWREDG